MALPRMHKFILPAGAWLLARIFLQELFPPRMHEFILPEGAAIGTNLFAGVSCSLPPVHYECLQYLVKIWANDGFVIINFIL
jgi:hypothetical protein